jgi:putative ABC transport system permease protein
MLVVVEIALSTMLLAGASLFIQSFIRLSGVDPGFRPGAVVAVDRIELPRGTGASRSAAFFDELLDRLRQSPGIVAAGATIGVPLDSRARFFVDDSTFSIAGRPWLPVGRRPSAALHVVSGDYFAAAGIPIKRGRSFDARDRANTAAVVIINETMARLNWPNADPVGQTLTHDLTILPGQSATRQIVGVVGDVRHFSLAGPMEPQMFIPHLQMPWPSMALLLRTSLPAVTIDAVVRDAVHALDAALPVPPARPMEQVVSEAVGPPRFRAWLIGLFAAAALVLATVGLYGTVAFSIQQRTRELALRVALGASPRQMMRLILGSGVKLAVVGTVLGIAAALAVTRGITTMLFAIGPMDPATYVVAPAAVIVVAASACYVPARRIRSIDPLKALSDDGA